MAVDDDRLPAFGPGMPADDGAELDVALAWPQGRPRRAQSPRPAAEPTASASASAAPEPTLADVADRLAALEAAVERLTGLVELVVDTMPGSSDGSAAP